MTAGFPNFFMLTGPGSPSVLSNMTVSIEQHVDWVARCLEDMREEGLETIEPTALAEAGWDQHVQDCGAITLYPTANSWYMGANVPGKPRVFLPYIGGVDAYRQACDEVASRGLPRIPDERARARARCRDGVIRRMQPDVAMVLEIVAALGLPPFESLPAADARALMAQIAASRPPGPEVGEVTDGVLPGAAGDAGRTGCTARPRPGPHPLVVYFHGGGWVLGNLDSDDPLCRDLCARSGALIVSVNYRHAPEVRFPGGGRRRASPRVRWADDHASELGGIPGQLAVAGWSAGGNVAAVACQRARDAGGPRIVGQLLMTPVTDCDMTPPSYDENGDGYVLTAPLMRWFWDHYCRSGRPRRPARRPAARQTCRRLPPAMVVDLRLRPAARRGRRLRAPLLAGRRGTGAPRPRPRPHPHVADDGRRGHLRGAGTCADGRGAAGFLRAGFRGSCFAGEDVNRKAAERLPSSCSLVPPRTPASRSG